MPDEKPLGIWALPTSDLEFFLHKSDKNSLSNTRGNNTDLQMCHADWKDCRKILKMESSNAIRGDL